MMIRGDGGYGPSLPELHRRLRWVALVGIAAFRSLVGRLWQLQVMRGDSYYQRTVSNVVKERSLPSVRGKILDRKGAPLADNRPAFNIYATPKLMTPETKEALVHMLAAFALLVGRLWQLQVMRGDSYYQRTVSNVVKERYLPSVRGKILDRKGAPLADNRPALNIYATPKLMTPETKEALVHM